MRKIIFISLFVFLFLSPLLSQGKKLKVIANKANIYLNASESSPIIGTVEEGTVLSLGQAEKTKKIWYKVYFISKSGATKAGYILDSLVELLSEDIGLSIITPKRYEKEPTERIEEVVYKYPKKIKVISEVAYIRLARSSESQVIEKVRLGTILQSIGKSEEWHKVNLPPSEEGIIISGYIHQSSVEEIVEKAPEVPKVEKKPPSIPKISLPKTSFPKKIELRTKSYLGAIVGYAIPSEKNYAGGLKFGGSLCFGITKNIAIELNGLRFQSIVKGTPEGLSDGKLSIIPIQISIQTRFPTSGRLIPYILAGGSYYINSFTLDKGIVSNWDNLGFDIKEEIKKNIGFHFGAGIDFILSSSIALDADFRYCVGKTKGTWFIIDQLSSTEISGNIESLSINSFILGIGLKFYL